MEIPKRRTQSTQTLREILLDAIEDVKTGKMETKDACAIAKLAKEVISTAELEIKYALSVSQLDRDGAAVTPGPLLLTGGKENNV